MRFNNKKILELYETGRSRKYNLDPQVIENFFEVIAILEAANDIYDLWNRSSLKFERLQSFKNRYSARITKKWRVEMTIEWKNKQKTIGIIAVEEVSCHYGD